MNAAASGVAFASHRHALGREPLLLQGVDAALRPREVLEHADREQRRFDLSHSVAPAPGYPWLRVGLP